MKDGACRRKDGLGIAGGVHDDSEMGNGAWTLTIVDVEGGERKRLEVVIADVGDNTDDGEETKVAINAAVFDGAADGILIGPFFVGNGLGDEGDVGRIEGVAIIKKAATDQWNAEGAEIIRRGYDIVGAVDLRFVVEDVVEERDDVGEQFGIRAKVTGGTSEKILHSRGKLLGIHGNIAGTRETTAGEGEDVGATDCVDAGNLADLRQQGIEKRDAFGGGKIGETEFHGGDAVGAEAGVDGKNAEKASAHEAGADEEDEGGSELHSGE